MERDQLKAIKGYPKYQVSSMGYVVSLQGKRPRILTPFARGRGYLAVWVSNENGKVIKSVHRLVAEAFIENPLNLPEANRLDEDKTNNTLGNLEWCDSLRNNIYSHGRAVTLISPYGEEIVFESRGELARHIPCNIGDASRLARGLLKTYKGWRLSSV